MSLSPEQKHQAICKAMKFNVPRIAGYFHYKLGVNLSPEIIFQILLKNNGKLPKNGTGSKKFRNALERANIR